MDAFKAQFERIRQQLAALSATQKMLVAALIAVMVLTVLYLGRYASNAEMVPVLDQTLDESDIGPITQQLKLSGVNYTVSTGKVLVPADRQSEILADLMFARVLPADTHSAFETMSKQINPFTSNNQVEKAYSEATAMELSELIGRFPGVANAHVIINGTNQPRIEGSIPPSATVFVTTRGEPENMKDLVRAAADGVAHAVSGLTPSQISVIVNGSSKKVPNLDSGSSAGSDDMNEAREKREADLEQKIRNEFAFITGLTVTVNCDIENRQMDEHVVKFDKASTVVQPLKTSTVTDESSSLPGGSRDPGASANTAGSNSGVSLDAGTGTTAAPTPNTTSTNKEDVTNEVDVGHDDITTHTPAGKDKVQSATVRVPRSYFTAIYKLQDLKTAPPLTDFISSRLTSIRDGVKKVVGLKTDDDLSVDTYEDIPVDMALATAPSMQASTLTTVGGHAKEIGVAVLAVVSLLMMATMVRKSTPAQLVLPAMGGGSGAGSVPVAVGLNALGTGESIAGEVGTGTGTLDGMEMDEESVRTQQMLDQVSTMVKENPDGAASLVKRWLSRA
jgi:flagellar biosynthesis/type III secretory pathway M-ring protein FliF/YscJ